jgi:hypothetical protein
VHPEGRTGLKELSGGVRSERLPCLEVVEVGEVGPVGDHRVREPEGAGQVADLVDGVVGEPLVDDRGQVATLTEQ